RAVGPENLRAVGEADARTGVAGDVVVDARHGGGLRAVGEGGVGKGQKQNAEGAICLRLRDDAGVGEGLHQIIAVPTAELLQRDELSALGDAAVGGDVVEVHVGGRRGVVVGDVDRRVEDRGDAL